MSQSTKDRRKKDRERFFLEQFCQTAGRPLHIVAEPEPPDFILRDQAGEFVVELAELFKDRRMGANGRPSSPGRQLEVRRSSFLRGIAAEYYRRGGRPLRVAASLPRSFAFPGPREVVEQLLARRPDRTWARCRLQIEPAATFDLVALPEEFAGYSNWDPGNTLGWRRLSRLDDAQEVVRAKAAEKLAAYRMMRSRVALLLYADGIRSSGRITWTPDFAPIEPCGFDEVLLYLHPSEAWRLSPGPAERIGSGPGAAGEAGR